MDLLTRDPPEPIEFEFGVHSSWREGEKVTVLGRCYLGPLRLGDAFCFAYQYEPEESPAGYKSATRGRITPVDLTIQSITAYGHDFEELDEGMTAKLVLVGQGDPSVRDGSTLGGYRQLRSKPV